jgi:hypothetical protein
MSTLRSAFGLLSIILTLSIFAGTAVTASPARPPDRSAVPDGAPPFAPVSVSGTVRAGGEGIGGVVITDGVTVIETDDDGSFAFLSSTRRRFVYMSIPAGYEIPVSESGTALFYKELREDGNGAMRADFELEELAADDAAHAFLLMADPQTQDSADVALLHAEAVPDVAAVAAGFAHRNVFAVAAGDIMYDNLELYPEYELAVTRMGIPCFQVFGNHDADQDAWTDARSTATFERHFGPRYYSFNRGEIHYVVLDDIFWFGSYIGYVDQEQLDWLEKDLSFIEPERTVAVFMHIPIYNRQHIRHGKKEPRWSVVVVNRSLVYEILEPYKTYMICGHMHESEYLHDGGAEIHICGALCGAWWTGPVCSDGTPMGYSVYEVRGTGITWRYKSLGEDFDHQMRLYPPGADNVYPDEVIANIWSADQDWKVYWYEDGVKQGYMQRRVGMDPLAEKLYRGDGRPEKRSWVEPTLTDHLFYAKPSPGAREIAVEAVDGWGRVYRETITLR